MSSNTQNYKHINKITKDLKISNNKFNMYGGQVRSRTSGCGTSFFQHFRSSKFSDKYDAGPATWAHVNGYIDACKCTEIFRNNLHSRVSKG